MMMEKLMCSVLWLSARIEVRRAAAQCLKNILATQSGVDFWEQHKGNRDPMLTYLNPFRTAKNKVGFRCLYVSANYLTGAHSKLMHLITGCRPRSGGCCGCQGEHRGQRKPEEPGVLDSPGGQPQELAEGSVHSAAGQRRGQV